ncbi:hypothetical protein SK128_016121, partial [Halocaridina rubra]
ATKEEVRLPTPHDLITQEHVLNVLKADRGTDAQLISWEIKDFTKKGDNMATFVTSVIVSYTEKGKSGKVSYAVKLNPCRNIKELDSSLPKIFTKEISFYYKFAPKLNSVLESVGQPPLRIPKCFHFNKEVGKEAIFLEDLRSRGFRMTEAGLSGVNFSHTMLLLKEVARLHASSWVLQQKRHDRDLGEEFEFLKLGFTKPSDAESHFFSKMTMRGNNVAITMLEHIGGYQKVVDWIKMHKASFMDIMQSMLKSSPPFDVACHGDLHVNNTLFRYDDDGNPVEIMLLDHQVNRIASLATDLNYFLFLNLTGEVRGPNLETFLQTYYDTFKEIVERSGEELTFSLEEFRQEFRNKHCMALVFALFLSPLLVTQTEDFPDASEFFGNTSEDVTEKERENILKAFDTNEALRKKLLSVFDEMEAVGVFD